MIKIILMSLMLTACHEKEQIPEPIKEEPMSAKDKEFFEQLEKEMAINNAIEEANRPETPQFVKDYQRRVDAIKFLTSKR